MQNFEILADDITCLLGEGPIYSEDAQKLFWVDILNGNLHTLEFQSNTQRSYHVGQFATSLAIINETTVLITRKNDIISLNLETSEIELKISIDDMPDHCRFNDSRLDTLGNLWIGSMDMNGNSQLGNLYKYNLETNKITIEDTGFIISNGIGWSKCLSSMFSTDSIKKVIYKYNFNKSKQTITNKEIFINFDQHLTGDAVPDGFGMDKHDNIYVACWDGAKILKISIAGKVIDEYQVPISKPTSCTFTPEGLIVTSARVDLSEQDLKEQSCAGKLILLKNIKEAL